MKIRSKINRFYSKYLYLIVPVMTIMIAGVEVIYEIRYGDFLHILANAFMGFISIAFLGFYLMSDKRRIDYCLIELYLFIYTAFLAMDNHLHFTNIVWIIFLPCAIFSMIFIIFFHKSHR